MINIQFLASKRFKKVPGYFTSFSFLIMADTLQCLLTFIEYNIRIE